MTARLLLALLLPLLPGVDRAQAQDSAWATQCIATSLVSPLRCAASHRIVTQSGERVFHVAFGTRQGQSGGELSVQGPLGIHLPGGLQVLLDGAAALELQFESCTGEGCLTGARLNPEQIEAFGKATSLQFVFQPAAGNRATVDVPTSGLADALRLIRG